MENKITLELTTDEAVVLFELLSRINQKSNTDLFEDQAEQRILWNLESDLESSLADPFRADYENVVRKARKAVRDSEK